MKKVILSFAMLTALTLTSCTQNANQESTEASTENVDNSADEIVKSISTDESGNKLEMTFNNTKDIVIINFNGEEIILESQRPASGIWYKNDLFELRGKGEDIELKKDGEVIFSNVDDIVKISATNEVGETLEMSFNNTNDEAILYFKGELIELKSERPASGIWYKNDHYELSGKGEQVELKKDGEIIFKN